MLLGAFKVFLVRRSAKNKLLMHALGKLTHFLQMLHLPAKDEDQVQHTMTGASMYDGRSDLDVGDGVLQARSHNIVECIHTPVGFLDLLIQGQEGRLERCQLNEQVNSGEEGLTAGLDLLSAAAQPCKAHLSLAVARCLLVCSLKLGQLDTGHIVLLRIYLQQASCQSHHELL